MNKICLIVVIVALGVNAKAQKISDSLQIINNVKALHKAVFVNKDSIALEGLFAAKVSYGHSGGRLETRSEAISNISASKSVYTNAITSDEFAIVNGNTAAGRYTFSATETNKEGKVTNLRIHIITVWTKVKGKWVLIARQAAKI